MRYFILNEVFEKFSLLEVEEMFIEYTNWEPGLFCVFDRTFSDGSQDRVLDLPTDICILECYKIQNDIMENILIKKINLLTEL